jgi:hypothetical protein
VYISLSKPVPIIGKALPVAVIKPPIVYSDGVEGKNEIIMPTKLQTQQKKVLSILGKKVNLDN